MTKTAETHGDLLKRRAIECPESPLSRELMMAGGWVNDLNAENARLKEALSTLIYDVTSLAPREDRRGFDEEVRRPIIQQSKIDRARAALHGDPQ